MGPGYATLRKRATSGSSMPRLPGWGQQVPNGELPSFDQIAQAFSGFAQHTGEVLASRPEIPLSGIADQTGAMNFASGS